MTKKRVACLLIVAVIFAFATYALTSGMLADHECTGEHCAVCLCASVVKSMAALCAAAMCAFAALPVRAKGAVGAAWLPARALWTPVCLKVKLSD